MKKNSIKILSAIVLAAGESKRMKERNKLLLPFRNKTVIRHVVENILASGLDEVIVVLGHEAEKVRAALADLPVKFVLNEIFEKGMTTSIQEGVRHASGDGYMICLSDMVMITAEEYAVMKMSFFNQRNLMKNLSAFHAIIMKKGTRQFFPHIIVMQFFSITKWKDAKQLYSKARSIYTGLK